MARGYHKEEGLKARQKAYDSSGLATKGKGYRRPGSNKKS